MPIKIEESKLISGSVIYEDATFYYRAEVEEHPHPISGLNRGKVCKLSITDEKDNWGRLHEFIQFDTEWEETPDSRWSCSYLSSAEKAAIIKLILADVGEDPAVINSLNWDH